MCTFKFLVAHVRCGAEVLCTWSEKHWLHFHTAQERLSLLLPWRLERGEIVLDPSLGGKREERERNLLIVGTADDKRWEWQEHHGTGISEGR